MAVDPPRFGDAPPEANRLLHAVLNCCVNETIASAHLRATLKAAVSPLVREVIRLLLADEIDHARVGWAHLASEHVTPQLPLALRCPPDQRLDTFVAAPVGVREHLHALATRAGGDWIYLVGPSGVGDKRLVEVDSDWDF